MFIVRQASPMRMIEPLPNCFSICSMAVSSAFAFSFDMALSRSFLEMARHPRVEGRFGQQTRWH